MRIIIKMKWFPYKYKTASKGSAIAFIALLIFTLITMMGLATYAGLNAYLQSELQKATTYAAGVGAASRFDDVNPLNAAPVQQANGLSINAANSAFNALVGQNPALTSFGAVAFPVLNGNEMTVNATVNIPTPFFSLVGVNQITIQASSTANYAQKNIDPANFAMDSVAGPFSRVWTIDPPLLNADGVELFIQSVPTTRGFHGYMVELCWNGGQCRDVSGAARAADANSFVIDRTYPNGTLRRVLYGNFFFDVESSSTVYNNNVARATGLKIIDDGVPDSRAGGLRFLELNPQPTQFSQITLFHQAVYCPAPGACAAPPSFTLF